MRRDLRKVGHEGWNGYYLIISGKGWVLCEIYDLNMAFSLEIFKADLFQVFKCQLAFPDVASHIESQFVNTFIVLGLLGRITWLLCIHYSSLHCSSIISLPYSGHLTSFPGQRFNSECILGAEFIKLLFLRFKLRTQCCYLGIQGF